MVQTQDQRSYILDLDHLGKKIVGSNPALVTQETLDWNLSSDYFPLARLIFDSHNIR